MLEPLFWFFCRSKKAAIGLATLSSPTLLDHKMHLADMVAFSPRREGRFILLHVWLEDFPFSLWEKVARNERPKRE